MKPFGKEVASKTRSSSAVRQRIVGGCTLITVIGIGALFLPQPRPTSSRSIAVMPDRADISRDREGQLSASATGEGNFASEKLKHSSERDVIHDRSANVDVETEMAEEDENPPAKSLPEFPVDARRNSGDDFYIIQFGAFEDEAKALQLQWKLKGLGYKAELERHDSGGLIRVQMSRVAQQDLAKIRQATLNSGIPSTARLGR